jgi:hypothetical protein
MMRLVELEMLLHIHCRQCMLHDSTIISIDLKSEWEGRYV